jgi:hypothetical protein
MRTSQNRLIDAYAMEEYTQRKSVITDFYNYGATRHPWTMTNNSKNYNFLAIYPYRHSAVLVWPYCIHATQSNGSVPFWSEAVNFLRPKLLWAEYKCHNIYTCRSGLVMSMVGSSAMVTGTGKIKQKQKINSHNELLQKQLLVHMVPIVLLWWCTKVVYKSNRNITIKVLGRSTWEDLLRTLVKTALVPDLGLGWQTICWCRGRQHKIWKFAKQCQCI